MKKNSLKMPVQFIALTGIMTALVLAFTMIGINVGTGFVNIGDTMIFITAALFGLIPAMLAGGLGAMFADLIVYPMTAVFTLFIKAAEGLIAGLLMRYALPKIIGKDAKLIIKIIGTTVCTIIAAVFMVAAYFGTNVLFWGDGDSAATRLSGAVAQLPWDVLQAGVSIVLSNLLLHFLRLEDIAAKFKIGRYLNRKRLQSKTSDTSLDSADIESGSQNAITDSDNCDKNNKDSDEKFINKEQL